MPVHFLRSFGLLAIAAVSTLAQAGDVIDPASAKPDEKADILWYDVKNLDLEGKGWTQTKAHYDRFPAKAEGKVRPEVWNLSRNSAGLAARFVTDAQTIHARWTLTSKRLEMPHMPSTGVRLGELRSSIRGRAVTVGVIGESVRGLSGAGRWRGR